MNQFPRSTPRRPHRRLAARPATLVRRHRDRGHVTTGMAGVFVLLFLLAGLLYDPGMALAARIQALDIAQAAARAGANQLDLTLLRTTGDVALDPQAAHAAATAFLQQASVEGGTMTGTVSATTGQVTVTITDQHPTVLLGLIGVSTLPVEATATAAPRTGDDP